MSVLPPSIFGGVDDVTVIIKPIASSQKVGLTHQGKVIWHTERR